MLLEFKLAAPTKCHLWVTSKPMTVSEVTRFLGRLNSHPLGNLNVLGFWWMLSSPFLSVQVV